VGFELACELAFRPVAQLVARALAPLLVPPPAVVLAGAATGAAAAIEIGRGSYLAAALLLQAKTVLDNADGQLARMTGRITSFGRYLDSESDLLVDAAVFAALGLRIGPWPALLGFVLLTSVLSMNFNLERLHRGGAAGARDGTLLARVYAALYGPQDKLAEALVRNPSRRSVAIAANFGLSTQLAALGLCLAVGHPAAYVVVLIVCTLVLMALVVHDRRRSEP
jgi:phosphatidylglycerophosphate synthase